MGGLLLHLVQREWAWVGCGPAQSLPGYRGLPNVTAHPSNGQCTTFILFDVAQLNSWSCSLTLLSGPATAGEILLFVVCVCNFVGLLASFKLTRKRYNCHHKTVSWD